MVANNTNLNLYMAAHNLFKVSFINMLCYICCCCMSLSKCKTFTLLLRPHLNNIDIIFSCYALVTNVQ